MKASVILYYGDSSTNSFDFESNNPDTDDLSLLLMVCRGTLMASIAIMIAAYDEDGNRIVSIKKY